MLAVFLIAVAVSALAGWLVLRFERLHSQFSHDHAASGPQKFHAQPTPRIGGVPIAAGFVAALAAAVAFAGLDLAFAGCFLLAALPAFASGLLEDLTKKIGPDIRLWASFLSALVAIYFFDTAVQRSGLAFVDSLLTWYPLALVVTTVGVGGVAHATNIIDGYNGLAGMVAVMMLGALGVVAWQVGDGQLLALCVALAGGTLGFLVWNFPRGRIFAGDGGAYLWGVSVALVSILMIKRHPGVSPWFVLVVVSYPVFETLFTVYRRKLLQASAAGLPDAKHLHQLVYRRLLRPHAARRSARLNAATSPFLWALAALAIVPGTFFRGDTSTLIGITCTFAVVYVWFYRALVTFSVPRSLRRLGRFAARLADARDAADQQHPERRPVLVGNGDRDAQ